MRSHACWLANSASGKVNGRRNDRFEKSRSFPVPGHQQQIQASTTSHAGSTTFINVGTMSGLEPLAALGLACNIFQLIELAEKSASMCKQVYETGQPDPALDDFAKNLANTSTSLKDFLVTSQRPSTSDEKQLLDLADKCQDAAADLTKEMASLANPPGKRWSAFLTTIKKAAKKRKLDGLEKKLKDAERIMETQLLVGMHQRLNISADQIEGLDRKLGHFIQHWSAGETMLSQLVLKETSDTKTQLSNELQLVAASTKAHIATESTQIQLAVNKHMDKATNTIQGGAQSRDEALRRDEAYERFLDSLRFDKINARRNGISSACPETFEWIFEDCVASDQDSSETDSRSSTDYDDSGDSLSQSSGEGSWISCDDPPWGSWDSLVEWLQSPRPLYWISGKAASGKSVLMKFIINHSQTMEELKKWNPDARILSHFFWKPGSMMEKCLKGLLCSLVHQTFVHDKDSAMAYLQNKPQLRHKRADDDWDVNELRDHLAEYLGQSTQALCIFIDGLDEFWHEDGVQQLFAFLEELQKGSSLVKICVSSRREHALETRLDHYPQLKMQDLTRRDIYLYAKTTLLNSRSVIGEPVEINNLVDDIVYKSDGVFLWAVLVARSLARGIEAGDSLEELDRRLSSAPKDLYGLFQDMWARLNADSDVYGDTSALLLSLVTFFVEQQGIMGSLHWAHNLSVLQLMAALSNDVLDRYLVEEGSFPPTELEKRCQRVHVMISVRSAGLLEVRIDPSWPNLVQDGPNKILNVHISSMVQFVHRTAFDFLFEEEDGRNLTQKRRISSSDVFSRLHRAILVDHIVRHHSPWATFQAAKDTLFRLRRYRQLLSGEHLAQLLRTTCDTYDHLAASGFNRKRPPIVWASVPACDIILMPLDWVFEPYSRPVAIAFGFQDVFLEYLPLPAQDAPSDMAHRVLFHCASPSSFNQDYGFWASRHRIIQSMFKILCSEKATFSSPSMGGMSSASAVKMEMSRLILRTIPLNAYLGDVVARPGSGEQIISSLQVFCEHVDCLNDHVLFAIFLRGFDPITNMSSKSGLSIIVEVAVKVLIEAVKQWLGVKTTDTRLWHKDLPRKLDDQAIQVNMIRIWKQGFSVESLADREIFATVAKSYLFPKVDKGFVQTQSQEGLGFQLDQATVDGIVSRAKLNTSHDDCIMRIGEFSSNPGLRLCKNCVAEEERGRGSGQVARRHSC